MNDPNILKNTLSIAKEALKFYGNHDNYLSKKELNNKTTISLDGGNQAMFALKMIDNLIESMGECYNNYDDEVFKHENQQSIDEVMRLFNEFKFFGNENN